MFTEKNPTSLTERQRNLDKIKQWAESGDVTFRLNRFFKEEMEKQDPELLEIQKKGFIVEAIKWLEKATKDGMKYGNGFTKDKRIEGAKKFAELAGTTIEELIEKNNIDIS